MGFGDKLKDLRKQAQEAVSEHSEQVHNALDAAAVAANAKTRGKHTQRITKFGDKASSALDKFADKGEGATAESDAADAVAPAAEAARAAEPAPAAEAPEPTMPAAEPEAPVSPPSAAQPPPSSAPPPPANPDLAAWAAGDDSAG